MIKKYLSKIQKDGQVLYIKDVEARDSKQDVIDANNPLSSDLIQYESRDVHEYVDLGLPSGTLWATMNVGAESITDYGNYYMYGKGATQYNSSDSPYEGTENPLSAAYDTATQVWGGDWHMPTKAQIQELIDNTTREWTTINGINGGKFIAQNGNYVFIPACGVYYQGNPSSVGTGSYMWSACPDSNGLAYMFYVNNNSIYFGENSIVVGCSVRPVIDSAPSDLTLTEKIEEIEDNLEEKADLVNGKVPASQLPSYVDDVIEGYYKAADGKFYESKSGSTYSTEITAEIGKIYVDLDSNKTFRWSGSAYVEISSSLAIGTTAGTAADGGTVNGHITDTGIHVTLADKNSWNGKQDALTFNTIPSSSNKVATMADMPTTMGASGTNHKSGLVPDTSSEAGTTKFLREDGTWVEPSVGSGELIHPLSSVSGTAAVTTDPYTCSKWAGTATGVTSLYDGLIVSIKVPVAGNATYGTTLNINSLGEHPILLNVSTMLSTQYAVGCIIELTYDTEATANVYLNSDSATTITGCWKIADYNTNTTYTNAKLGQGYATCTTAAATAAKVATLSSYSLTTGGIVTVKFSYDVPANATLSINSQTAKAIYHKGAKITDGVIKAGDFATFIYSSYYHLISLNRNFDDTFGGSGSNHSSGLVPDPGSTAGTTKFLREDGTWVVPAYPAAQVQSDWNATSGMGVILNKPTIPVVPTNISAFTNDAGYLTQHQDISGKEDKITIDSTTKQSSFTAYVGNYYKVSFPANGSITITLTTPASTHVCSCIFTVFTNSNPSLTIAAGNIIYFAENYEIEPDSNYEINALWNGTSWFITSVKFGHPNII